MLAEKSNFTVTRMVRLDVISALTAARNREPASPN